MKRQPVNIDEVREIARRKLPRAVFDYVDGGAEDEVTLRANRAGFESIRFRPRIHTGTNKVDLSTSLCSQPMSMPLMLSPTGLVGMVHSDGERGSVTVGAQNGLIVFMSGGGNYTIEEVAAAASTRPWYQLYPWGDRDFYGRLIDRAAAAGFRGLAVTVDTSARGRREKDLINGLTTPPRLTLRNAYDILRRPRWTAGVIRHRRLVIKAFDETRPPLRSLVGKASTSAERVTGRMTRVTWDELEWIRSRWDGPLAIKGILDPGDAEQAVEIGANVIIVSNHGGRQLDGAVAGIEALPAIVDAIGDSAEVVLDGGIRRGSDVVKALCLGARACMVGRPWVYGLADGGAPGIETVIGLFRHEIETVVTLLGQPSVRQLDRSFLVPAGVPGFQRQTELRS